MSKATRRTKASLSMPKDYIGRPSSLTYWLLTANPLHMRPDLSFLGSTSTEPPYSRKRGGKIIWFVPTESEALRKLWKTSDSACRLKARLKKLQLDLVALNAEKLQVRDEKARLERSLVAAEGALVLANQTLVRHGLVETSSPANYHSVAETLGTNFRRLGLQGGSAGLEKK